MNEQFIHLNGRIIPEPEAQLPAISRGIAYGDGCFTTLRSYESKFLHFDDHIDRLKSGADYLKLNSDFSKVDFRQAVLKLLEANSLSDKQAKVRIQLTRKGGGGFSELSSEFHQIITVSEADGKVNPVRLTTADTKSIPSKSLSRTVKLSNSINYIKAAQEARDKGFDDGLMTTISGSISETSISNIFWIRNNQVYTPSIECDLLPGVMRKIVFRLIDDISSLELVEGKFSTEELILSDAAFCTNAFREIYPVQSFENKEFNLDHPTVKLVEQKLEEYKQEHLN